VTAVARARAAWRSGPLAQRNFQLLAGGQFTSTVGDYCYAVALPWLVLSAHGGPVLLGTVLACYGVPRTVLIPVGGILADKIGPRTIMLAADAARCVLVTALVVLASQRLASLPLLAPVAALLGAGEGLFLPASFTIMPALLKPDQLAAGNALSSAMVQAGSLAGPVLGGLLVASAGSAPAFAVDAATFAVSAITLALLRPASLTTAAQAPAPADDAGAADTSAADTGPAATEAKQAGIWQLLREERLLQVIVVLCVAANLAYSGAFAVALPALAHARYSAGGYGALIACLGAGSVAGTLAAMRSSRLSRPAIAACLSFLAEAVAVSVLPFPGQLAGAAAATAVLGACNGFGNIIMITLLQQWAPGYLLGRVMSLVMLAAMGTFPVSVAVTGIAVHSFGPVPFFPVAGGILALAMLGALTQPVIRTFGAGPAQPRPLEAEPA
jgi:predicted MFS family arabinose efflux permease